jgi:hypothetical protein
VPAGTASENRPFELARELWLSPLLPVSVTLPVMFRVPGGGPPTSFSIPETVPLGAVPQADRVAPEIEITEAMMTKLVKHDNRKVKRDVSMSGAP